ncbi:MAG: hypothetical protein OXU20_17295 [Myxococcales bacterium]|nr:hypothetical protein [Myxococcales bacterium]
MIDQLTAIRAEALERLTETRAIYSSGSFLIGDALEAELVAGVRSRTLGKKIRATCALTIVAWHLAVRLGERTPQP